MTQKGVKSEERREDMQTRRARTLALRLMAILALVGALALLGCPDDEEDTVTIGTQVVGLNARNAAALVGDTLVFPGPDGVPAFNTGRTRVVFNDVNAATISSGNRTTVADVAYGSCIFTFSPDSPIEPGERITIDACNLIVNGGEFTVGGPSGACTIRLELGVVLSEPVNATCSINGDEEIVVNETTITGSVGVGG
jgi:hypothetical protein